MKTYTIKELIDETYTQLVTSGLSLETIKSTYLRIITKLYDMFDQSEIFEERMVYDLYKFTFNKEFIEHTVTICQRQYQYAFEKMLMVYHGNDIKQIPKKYASKTISAYSQMMLDAYIAKSRSDGNRIRTIDNKTEKIRSFLIDVNIETASADDIRSYISNQRASYRTISVTKKLKLLRRFILFCYENHWIRKEILLAWPIKFASLVDKNIPSVYSIAEIKLLLESAKKQNFGEYNDMYYAMLCLVTYSGIRAIDVVNLKMTDINWRENKITFIQSKTKKKHTIPLIPEIGNPLMKYLLNRKIKSNNVFITPSGNTIRNSCFVTYVISRYFRRSPIKIGDRHFGPHSLRHSLATNLINQQLDAFKIANVLGHSNINTIKVYAKVDITSLRKCILEAPYNA